MMWRVFHNLAIALTVSGGVAGCAPVEPVDQAVFAPQYLGVDTLEMGDDLVSLFVTMRGARNRADVATYADCAVAGYALRHDYGFARHVRTIINEKRGVWSGDAVYTVSVSLPRGIKTIDAQAAVAKCVENGIPRV